ncbi:MAG TPA: ABC transporter substrate-binding protein [Tissierellaceae bacterium]
MNLLKRKSVIILILLSLLLTSCSVDSKSEESGKLRVGIIQLTQHPALDDARVGFEEEIKDLDVEIIYQNAQGNIPNITTIAQKMVRDKVDLIFAISTPVAQSLKNIDTDIPVIFTAITDPVSSEIVDSFEKPNTNFSGTSDEAPIKEQFELLINIKEDIKDIGVIYNTSELNSKVQVEQIQAVCDELGLSLQTMGVNNINEIPKACDSLMKKVDAIYTPTDNMIASSIQVISQKAINNNILTLGAEKAHVDGGILFTKGINYKDLGSQSANMAKEILVNGKDISSLPVEKSKNIQTVINKNTLEKLNLDIDLSFDENILIID